MWIWYVSQSDGGNLQNLIADAHRYGIGTLLIKSGRWERAVVAVQLDARSDACTPPGSTSAGGSTSTATNPTGEAQVGADTVQAGADCLMIDAEGEYEGKYVAAQTYIRALRTLIGSAFPVALAGLPYIDYHPAFPYSVFLGPGGAQYNAPQMYWADIGTSVDRVFAHTYEFNAIYNRPIYPLGQVSGSPPPAQIERFRQLSRVYGAPGLSWWDWQESSPSSWNAISTPIGAPSDSVTVPPRAALGMGARGDIVVWAQEHLHSAGENVTIDGSYGSGTQSAVTAFQQAQGLLVSGTVDAATWQALLKYAPVPVTWTKSGAKLATTARAAGAIVVRVPASAHLRDRGRELRDSRGRH